MSSGWADHGSASAEETQRRRGASRRAAVLVTDLGDGRDRVVRGGRPVAGALGEAIAKAIPHRDLRHRSEAEGRGFFLNVHLPQPRLVVIGAVHISQALAPMARIAGFDMEIIDPRTAFATPGALSRCRRSMPNGRRTC